jgi:hypothetical protein
MSKRESFLSLGILKALVTVPAVRTKIPELITAYATASKEAEEHGKSTCKGCKKNNQPVQSRGLPALTSLVAALNAEQHKTLLDALRADTLYGFLRVQGGLKQTVLATRG